MPTPAGNRYLVLGDERLPLGASPGTAREKGIRVICPQCGETWGKVELGGGSYPGAEYLIARWPCSEHGSSVQVGGSLWKLITWWDRSLAGHISADIHHLSREFLEREILLKAAQLLGLTLETLQK